MNGKVSRALRHAKTGNVDMNDIGILSRRMAAQSRQFDMRPKFTEQRIRKQVPLQTALAPRTLIVQNPMRLIRKYIQDHYTSFSNLTGGAVANDVQAGRLPKHLLDRMALAI